MYLKDRRRWHYLIQQTDSSHFSFNVNPGFSESLRSARQEEAQFVRVILRCLGFKASLRVMRWMFLYPSQKEAEDSSFLSNCSDAVFEFLQIFAMCNTLVCDGSRLWRHWCVMSEGWRNYIIRFKSQIMVEWCGGEGGGCSVVNQSRSWQLY